MTDIPVDPPPEGEDTGAAAVYDLGEPRIHGYIGGPLPTGHWLLARWDFDNAVDTIVVCEQCGRPIYDRFQGTLVTWVETGRISIEHGEPEAQVWCLRCFGSNGHVWPRMLFWWALFNGHNQPQVLLDDSVTFNQMETIVTGNCASAAQTGWGIDPATGLTPPEDVPE